MVGLLVPIDLTAYCVGIIDANNATPNFAGATTDYTNQDGDNSATLSANVVRAFDDSPNWALEAGIHLHWAMPDALTHGTQNSDNLVYSALPNRWLVTRYLINGTSSTTKTWIITSDILTSQAPTSNIAPTLPVTDTQVNYRYVGVWELFSQNWVEPTIPPNQTIEALFGSPLHAVASGDIAFAAFYPNVRNVFGFYDDMSDVAQGTAADVAYTVAGWFSNAASDPLNTPLTLDQLQTTYQWTCSNYPAPPPSYSLYHGQIQEIQWNSATRYIQDNAPAVAAEVAIGNNPAEALAAYFGGQNNNPPPNFDDLFTAFEIGALSQLQQPQPGQWSAMLETLHANQFTNNDGGIIYTIVQEQQMMPPGNRLPGTVEPPLPPALAHALNLLNQYQQEFAIAQIESAQYLWQLFAGWYRIIEVNPGDAASAYNSLQALLSEANPIQQNYTNAQTALAQQMSKVTLMLPPTYALQKVTAPAYMRPNEPVVLLAGDGLKAARRYGGDGRYHEADYLHCRLTTQVITALQVNVNGTKTLNASQFSAVALPQPNHLLYSDDITALREEACLLNTTLTAALVGGDATTLENDLIAWLTGTQSTGNSYQQFTGTLPSKVGIEWWAEGNPWFPMVLLWRAAYYPLFATKQKGNLQNYPAGIFTSNYSVDVNEVGTIVYTPGIGPNGIDIDPKTIDFSSTTGSIQFINGSAILSPSGADQLALLLAKYPNDPILQKIYAELETDTILMQALSGFNAALLMQEQTLQLYIATAAATGSPVAALTQQVITTINQIQTAQQIPQIPPFVPDLNAFYNPFRAGYMELTLRVVDTFGQKRPVTIQNLYVAPSMQTVYKKTLEGGIIYLQPRLSQSARLLFRWLAADTTDYDEMNPHPAMTPVCGWLLNNHLDGGFFIYNQQGRPLGSLTLSDDQTRIIWQSAPGETEFINQDVATVMAHQNPHLAQLVVALAQSFTPQDFLAFWTATDEALTLTTPTNPDSGAGMSVLVGRPLAVVQASMVLELQGFGSYNWGWDTLSNGEYLQTDNDLSGIQFPVVLGNLQQIDDGLVGYFKQAGQGTYNLSTFYTEAAAAASTTNVVQPTSTTLLLTSQSNPAGSPPSVNQGEQKVLMLMDPRAGIHLTSGILPTQFLQIPPDQYSNTLRELEMTFLTTPVLKPLGGVALPLADEEGYLWSWVEEQPFGSGSTWVINPTIGTATAMAMWTYSPQSITEGWLRLTPLILRYTLTNSAGEPTVIAGSVTTLTLTLTNLISDSVTFVPSSIVNEGDIPTGSIFYIHFGTLVAPGDIPAIQITATGWTCQALNDTRYGNYWAVVRTSDPLRVDANQSVSFNLTNVKIANNVSGPCKLAFDYYHITGIAGDGVSLAALTVQSPTS